MQALHRCCVHARRKDVCLKLAAGIPYFGCGEYICFTHALTRHACIAFPCLRHLMMIHSLGRPLIGNCYSQMNASFSQALAHEHLLVSPAWNHQALDNTDTTIQVSMERPIASTFMICQSDCPKECSTSGTCMLQMYCLSLLIQFIEIQPAGLKSSDRAGLDWVNTLPARRCCALELPSSCRSWDIIYSQLRPRRTHQQMVLAWTLLTR